MLSIEDAKEIKLALEYIEKARDTDGKIRQLHKDGDIDELANLAFELRDITEAYYKLKLGKYQKIKS